MEQGEQRYFERRQVKEAIAWAEEGGIAVHRNFDHWHGTRSARGFVMTRPFLHVIGLRPVLERWADGNGVPRQAIQPEKRRKVAHIDVFGDYALQLLSVLEPFEATRASFANFIRAGSEFYADLCRHILEDREVLELASHCPPGQPPPNLFFGAVHYLLLRGVGHPLAKLYPSLNGGREVGEDAYPAFRHFALDNAAAIEELMRTRGVQTNEVGRSAVLQRGFAVVEERSGLPLDLVEVGASAGLNLVGDRYGYSYGGREVGQAKSPVRIECILRGDLKPPFAMANVRSRVGIDRSPVDIADIDQALWLRALVWPDENYRAELLMSAIRAVRDDPPKVLKGDALDVLAGVLDSAPSGGALCVYSSFALYQLRPAERERLEAIVGAAARRRPVYRLSLEWFPGVQPKLLLLELGDGQARETELAAAHHHGQWLEWLDPETASV